MLVVSFSMLSSAVLQLIRASAFGLPHMVVLVAISGTVLGLPEWLHASVREADAAIRAWLLGPLFSKRRIAGFYVLAGVLTISGFGIIVAPVHGVAIPAGPVAFCAFGAAILLAAGIWMDATIARIKRSITPNLTHTR
jgi:hypothetical protein